MKVTLVNPAPMLKAELHDMPDHPHLGLAYLAAVLEKKGVDVRVVDAKLERLDFDSAVERILERKDDLIGFSAYTHDVTPSARLAEKIKRKHSDTLMLLGGVHVTALPEETMEKFPVFDLAAIGEAEVMFGDLVDWFNGKKDLHNVKGIVFREDGRLIVNSEKNVPMDLDAVPFPAWHLFPKADGYHIITARGCPYQCVFCMSPYGRDLTRERSPKNSVKEMEMTIEAYNPKYYKFNDETFGLNRKRALDILDLIVAKGLHKVPKIASMRGNLVDPEILAKMKEAGFNFIDYGVETGDPNILRIIKKGVTLEQTRRAVKITKEAGIGVGTNFILGHPHDTLETMNRTLDYAASLNPDLIAIGIMVPYPGTEVAEYVKRGEGGYKVLSTNWEDYNKQLGNAVELENVSRRQLELLQLKGYTMTYLRNGKYWDFAKFCYSYRRAALAFARNFVKKKYHKPEEQPKTVDGGWSESAIRGRNFWSGTPN